MARAFAFPYRYVTAVADLIRRARVVESGKNVKHTGKILPCQSAIESSTRPALNAFRSREIEFFSVLAQQRYGILRACRYIRVMMRRVDDWPSWQSQGKSRKNRLA